MHQILSLPTQDLGLFMLQNCEEEMLVVEITYLVIGYSSPKWWRASPGNPRKPCDRLHGECRQTHSWEGGCQSDKSRLKWKQATHDSVPEDRSYLDWKQGMKREERLMPREQNVQESSSKSIWLAKRSSIIQFVCLIPQQLVLCWIQLRTKSQIHGTGLSSTECEEMQCYKVS